MSDRAIVGLLNFIEAFLTVEVAGLGGVMVHGGTYMWPSWPSLAFITVGAVLAGIRKIQASLAPPPK